MTATTTVDVQAALAAILKRHDRIGFGRRGVLDAEEEIGRLAAGLAPDARRLLDQAVTSWLEPAQAERIAAALHYNLADHLQALALRLCARLPIPESLPRLRQLAADGAFAGPQQRLCRESLLEALAALH